MIQAVAARALAAAYEDEWAIKRLRKQMKKGGGLGGLARRAKSVAPWSNRGQYQATTYAQPGREENPNYLAASVLLHIGDAEAFEWTNDRLEDRNPPDGVSRNSEIHAALLRDLVTRFPDNPVTLAALNDRDNRSDPSVAFMIYAARAGTSDNAP